VSAEFVELQAAIVADLAGRVDSFNLTGWVPKRAYLPKFDLGTLRNLQVVTTPASRVKSDTNRGVRGRRLEAYVGVLKKLDATSSDQVSPPANLSELDGLIEFVERLDALFQPPNPSASGPYRIGADGKFRCVESAIVPLYDLEHMQTLRQFSSVNKVTFEVF